MAEKLSRIYLQSKHDTQQTARINLEKEKKKKKGKEKKKKVRKESS
ncbi:hypothetical protein KJ707_01830 [Patescibacteria group bacterium]|nr:hypothetical protein [Patescibacteria group bacterium]MBU1967070.1 hypothetical protein [Patescibacteria group bacterium]MBU2543291.1 hypothetical protein [Patescibacteria group bacterium]